MRSPGRIRTFFARNLIKIIGVQANGQAHTFTGRRVAFEFENPPVKATCCDLAILLEERGGSLTFSQGAGQ
jgi:hypothetical protein